MKVKAIYRLLAVSALLSSSFAAGALDGGTYSGFAPYSLFGIGDISAGGSAYNMTMGGVGIASRNNRYINSLNPAAVTARDSLAFMSDISLSQMNTIFRQGDKLSASNVFNMNDFIISTPLVGKSAMMFGVKPFSSTGYSYGYYETNPLVLGSVGNVAHAYTGQGSMYQLFFAAGTPVWKGLNLGVEYIHYFGNIGKTYNQTFSDAATIGISQNYDAYMTANSFKAGLQYEQKIGKKWIVVAGATYRMGADISGYANTVTTSGDASISSSADTLSKRAVPMRIADEMGFGISVNYNNRIRAEIDYTRSDWTKSNFETYNIFSSGVSHTVRAGFEIIPNPNDIRYYHNLITYRAGAYFSKQGFSVNGNPVFARGITLGATLPVFRWYNGVTIGIDLGQRGSVRNEMIRETYIGFNFGMNLFDIWFQQHHYD